MRLGQSASSQHYLMPLASQTFIRHQIMLDDTEDADVLVHLLPSIHFIQAELDKGRGVLVHCQAGISKHRPVICPWALLSTMYRSKFNDSRRIFDVQSRFRHRFRLGVDQEGPPQRRV